MLERIPYSIPHLRDITAEERALLSFALEREDPSRLPELDDLRVVARCGCGRCPTVLFRRGRASDPLTAGPARQIASYRGVNAEGVSVGVVLTERNGELAELEAWAPEGGDIGSWPALSNLEAFPWK
jgi:hypothetical protein